MSTSVGLGTTSKSTHAAATRRTLAISLAGILIWLAWVLIGLLTALPTADTGRDVVGRVGTIGALFGASLVLVWLGARPWLPLALLAALMLVTPLTQRTAYADSTAGTLLIVLGLTVGIEGHAGRAIAMVLLGSAGHTIMALTYGDALMLNLQDVVLASVLALAGAAFMGALTGAATALDIAETANVRQEGVVVRRAADLAATTANQRVLHDDVLGILNLIAEGIGQPDRVRRQAEAALAAIREAVGTLDNPGEAGATSPVPVPSPPESLRQLLERVCAAAPLGVRLVAPRRLATELTHGQADALVRALSEAIRNAARHAGVAEVDIEVTPEPAGVTIAVVDLGNGIAPGTSEGYGTRHSIRLPVETIGGVVDISSSPRGTRVALHLPVLAGGDLLVDAHDLTLAAARPVSWSLRLVGPIFGLAWIGMALPLAWPDPALVGLAFGWLGMTGLVIVRLGRGALTWRWVAGLTGAIIGLQVVAATMLPPGSLLDWRSWTYGFSAVPLVLMAFVLPLRASLPVIVGNASVPVLAAAVSPVLSSGVIPLGAVSGAVTSPLAAMLVGWLVRRQGVGLRQEQARRRALDYNRQVQRAREAGARRYFRQVEKQVVPWLAAVASGEKSASDPVTALAARQLAMTVRDDLHAPGVLDEHLQAAVARHRLSGGSVELRAGLDAIGSDARVLGLLAGLLDIADAGGRVIVALQDGDLAHGLRISLVPAPPPSAIEAVIASAEIAVTVNADDYRAVVLLDLRGDD